MLKLQHLGMTMTQPQKQQLLAEFDDGDITFREFFERYEAMLLQEVEQRIASSINVARQADVKKTKVLLALLVVVTTAAIIVSPPVYKELFGYSNAEECVIHVKNKYAVGACYDLYPSVTPQLTKAANDSLPAEPQVLPVATKAAPAKISVNTAPPLPNPAHGSIYWFNNGFRELVAPFEIKSAAGVNYFVKFSDASTGADVLGIFVVGGRPVSTTVPTGRYIVKYATGNTWWGYEDYFGQDTAYSKANTILDFRSDVDGTAGYSLTLYRVENGNLRTSKIKREEF